MSEKNFDFDPENEEKVEKEIDARFEAYQDADDFKDNKDKINPEEGIIKTSAEGQMLQENMTEEEMLDSTVAQEKISSKTKEISTNKIEKEKGVEELRKETDELFEKHKEVEANFKKTQNNRGLFRKTQALFGIGKSKEGHINKEFEDNKTLAEKTRQEYRAKYNEFARKLEEKKREEWRKKVDSDQTVNDLIESWYLTGEAISVKNKREDGNEEEKKISVLEYMNRQEADLLKVREEALSEKKKNIYQRYQEKRKNMSFKKRLILDCAVTLGIGGAVAGSIYGAAGLATYFGAVNISKVVARKLAIKAGIAVAAGVGAKKVLDYDKGRVEKKAGEKRDQEFREDILKGGDLFNSLDKYRKTLDEKEKRNRRLKGAIGATAVVAIGHEFADAWSDAFDDGSGSGPDKVPDSSGIDSKKFITKDHIDGQDALEEMKGTTKDHIDGQDALEEMKGTTKDHIDGQDALEEMKGTTKDHIDGQDALEEMKGTTKDHIDGQDALEEMQGTTKDHIDGQDAPDSKADNSRIADKVNEDKYYKAGSRPEAEERRAMYERMNEDNVERYRDRVDRRMMYDNLDEKAENSGVNQENLDNFRKQQEAVAYIKNYEKLNHSFELAKGGNIWSSLSEHLDGDRQEVAKILAGFKEETMKDLMENHGMSEVRANQFIEWRYQNMDIGTDFELKNGKLEIPDFNSDQKIAQFGKTEFNNPDSMNDTMKNAGESRAERLNEMADKNKTARVSEPVKTVEVPEPVETVEVLDPKISAQIDQNVNNLVKDIYGRQAYEWDVMKDKNVLDVIDEEYGNPIKQMPDGSGREVNEFIESERGDIADNGLDQAEINNRKELRNVLLNLTEQTGIQPNPDETVEQFIRRAEVNHYTRDLEESVSGRESVEMPEPVKTESVMGPDTSDQLREIYGSQMNGFEEIKNIGVGDFIEGDYDSSHLSQAEIDRNQELKDLILNKIKETGDRPRLGGPLSKPETVEEYLIRTSKS